MNKIHKDNQKYQEMRKARRARMKSRLKAVKPFLDAVGLAKKNTASVLVGFGKKYKALRYPVIAVLAVLLFVYNFIYYGAIHIRLRDKLAKGVAAAMTVCLVATSIQLTAFAVSQGNSSDDNGVSALSEEDSTVITFGNNKYAYGKNMSSSTVQLVAEVESGTVMNVQWQCSPSRTTGYTDMAGETSLTTSSFAPADGYWYRCVVNYNYKTKPVQLAKAYSSSDGAVINNSTLNSGLWYVTNGYIAYHVEEKWFDVIGKYAKNGTEYWLGTSYAGKWAIFTSTSAYPTATDCSSAPNGGLEALRVSFIPGQDYGISMEADLASGSRAFAFGCDTMLGNNNTSGDYSDRASLKAIKNDNNVLTQIQMVGAYSVDSALTTDPSFVIRFDQSTMPTYYWLGRYSSRMLWTNSESTDDVKNTDSGMTVSWCNREPGSSVKLQFRVGSVEDAGAAIKATSMVTSTKIVLSDLDSDYVYRLEDAEGDPLSDCSSPDADGTITYDGLNPNTKYQVTSKPRNSSSSTGTPVDVDSTTALDPMEGGNTSGGSGGGSESGSDGETTQTAPVVTPDYTTITISNANTLFSYCLQDEDGYDITAWKAPDSNKTVVFDNLEEGQTYYLVAKTQSNQQSDMIPFTTLIHTYVITYDDNVEGVDISVPDSQSKKTGQTVVIPSYTPVRVNYIFLGWNTDSNAEAALYVPGGTYTDNADVTLYAVWKLKDTVTVTEDKQSFTYDGESKAYTVKPGTGMPTGGYSVSYREAGTEVAVDAPVNAGFYDVIVTRNEDASYLPFEQRISNALEIKKAACAVPTGLSVQNVSFYTENGTGNMLYDGKIMGVDDTMEYRAENESEYHDCTGSEITGLAAGTYYVRQKPVDNNHVESADTSVTVGNATLDNFAPTAILTIGENSWDGFAYDLNSHLFYKEAAIINISVNDYAQGGVTGCGTGRISFFKDSAGKTYDEVKEYDDWTELEYVNDNGTCTASVTVEPSGMKIVYVRAEDVLGNVKYYCTDGIKVYRVDDVVPVESEEDLRSALDAGLKNPELADDIILSDDLTLPDDVNLIIPDDKKLTVPDGTNLTVPENSQISGDGEIEVEEGGALDNDGLISGVDIDNDGDIDNSGTIEDSNIDNDGKFANDGTVSDSDITNDGDIDNKGTIDKDSSVTNNSNFENSGAMNGPVTEGEGSNFSNDNEVSWTDKDGKKHYGSLSDALENADEGSTIVLEKDCLVPEGEHEVPEDTVIVVPEDKVLIIPDNSSLTIPSDSEIDNNGMVRIEEGGKLGNNGTITGGKVENDGELDNGGIISDSNVINNNAMKNSGTVGKNGTVTNNSDIENDGAFTAPVTSDENANFVNNSETSWVDSEGNQYYGSLKDAIDNADEGSKITVDNDVMIPGGEQYELPEGVELVIPEGEKITVPSGSGLNIPEDTKVSNDGTIKVDEGGSLDSDGTIEGGSIENDGDFTNSGTVAGSDISNNGGFVNDGTLEDTDITNDGHMENSGVIDSDSTVANNGDIDNSGTINGPVTEGENSTVSNSNEVSWTDSEGNRHYGSLKDAIDNAAPGSKITIEKDVTIPEGEQYELPEGVELVIPEGKKITVPSGSGLHIPEDTKVSNDGTIKVDEGGSLDSDGTMDGGSIENDGDFTNNGTVAGSDISNNGDFTNSGTLEDTDVVNDGQMDNSGTIDGRSTVSNNGSINNSGKITGPVKEGAGSTVSNSNEASWLDSDGNRHYGSLKDAIDNAAPGSQIILEKDIVLPSGSKLIIPEGVTVTIPENVKFTVSAGCSIEIPEGAGFNIWGSLDVKQGASVHSAGVMNITGSLFIDGNVTNDGIMNNNGVVSGSGTMVDNKAPHEPEEPVITENVTGENDNDTEREDRGNLVKLDYEQAKTQPINKDSDISIGKGNLIISIVSVDEDGNKSEQSIKGVILTNCENVVKACLTETELKEVKNGTTIEISLNVRSITTNVSEADKREIDAKTTELQSDISGLTVGRYIDISVMKKVGDDEWAKVSVLSEELEICLDIPSEIKKSGRTYYMMRNHDGECTLLEDNDNNADTITIRTHLFSAYAIVYTDETILTKQPPQITASLVMGNKVGCHWHFMIMAMMVICLVALTALRRNALWTRVAVLAINVISSLAFIVAGACTLDIVCFILNIVLSMVVFTLVMRIHKIECKDIR